MSWGPPPRQTKKENELPMDILKMKLKTRERKRKKKKRQRRRMTTKIKEKLVLPKEAPSGECRGFDKQFLCGHDYKCNMTM